MDIKDSKVVSDTPANLNYSFHDSVLEKRITGILVKLPILQRSDRYIDSITNHKNGMTCIIDTLVKVDTDIFISADFNGEDRFEHSTRFM